MTPPTRPLISIVVGITRNHNAIGNGGRLLVHISDDLKRFKALTTGHPIIMGRKTYESIGRALPDRTNYIVTRNQDFQAKGTVVCASLDEAIDRASSEEMARTKIAAGDDQHSDKKNREIFLIGGGEIYAQGLPRADRLYLTIVESDAAGDVHFPDYREFKKVLRQEDRHDEETGLDYSWVDLER